MKRVGYPRRRHEIASPIPSKFATHAAGSLKRVIEATHLCVIGVLVEVFVKATVEEGQGSPGTGTLEGCGADQLEVAAGLGLCEEVVEPVPHLLL